MKTIIQKIVKSIFLFSIFFSLFAAHAQAPQKMSYQAVIRNASGALIVNTPVAVKVSIFDAANGATPVYVERHTTTTNSNGLATFNIGTGTIISGVFASINWANIPMSIKTETDPAGGTNYTIGGTNELTSVPFSLNSGDNRWTKIGNNITNNNSGNVGIGNFSPDFPLSFPSTYGQKISLWGNAAASAGFGVQPGKLQMFTEVSTSDIEFGFGSSPAIDTNMIIKGTGNVGIGNINPGYILDLSKRMRLRSESSQLGAGIWFNKNDNSSENIFLGNDLNNNFQVYSNVGQRTIATFNPASGGLRVEGPSVSTSTAKALSVGGYGKIEVDAPGVPGGRFNIQENGNIGIGTNAPTTKLEVNGFTKLGTDAPAIKVKKLTGTTSPNTGGAAYITHGLTPSKILSVSVLVELNANQYVPDNFKQDNIYEFSYFISGINIAIFNSATGSSNILSKPVKIIITYEE